MKITPQILSIPPYLSTKWNNVSSIRLKADDCILVISLTDGSLVEIPNLNQRDIDEIFKTHAEIIEKGVSSAKGLFENAFSFSLPMKTEGGILDPLTSQLEHNPLQSELPPLPPAILEKITTIVQSLGLEEIPFPEEAHQNCNCIYCQLVRSFNPKEEIVDDADLMFRDWVVSETGKNLFQVTNPSDKNERFDVFLGDPLGCTCGNTNCEHIRAALNS